MFIISIVFVYTRLNIKTGLFQTIHFSVSAVSISKTVPFQSIQFSIQNSLFEAVQFRISTYFSSICPLDWTLSDATTLGHSGPGSDGNEDVLRISPSSSTNRTSPSDWLEPYLGHPLMVVLPLCRWCSRYRRRKGTRRYEFKSWTRLIAFHIALIPLRKVWIQLFSLQLWVNSRTD